MRTLDAEKILRVAEKSGLEINVFLAGPYIPFKKGSIPLSKYSDAARLRFDLFARLEENRGVTTILGEHERLKDVYRAHFDEYNNAALMEVAHVNETADCVVIIPSSPGSFSELGMFAMYKDICPKMLILLDKSHRKKELGYVHLGPVANAVSFGATAVDINYKNFEMAWAETEKYLRSIKAQKLASRYMMGKK